MAAHHRIGLITLVLTMLVVIVWGGIVPLAGAVVVGGTFVVHSSPKKIQHKTGGVVKEIAVQDGKKIKAGDVLIRFDANDAKARHASVLRLLDETQLKIARLTAERDAMRVEIPKKFYTPPEEYAKMVKAEIEFWKARQATLYNNQRLADARVAQLGQQIDGLKSQLGSNKNQGDINEKELSGVNELYKKKITTVNRITPLQREKARLQGAKGQIEADIQSDAARIGEIKLQVQQANENFRADVMKDLSDATAKQGQLFDLYLITNETLHQTDVFAPVSGTVHELAVHTVNGVVSAGETIMVIIPDDDRLEVAVRLSPDRIDQVRVGQKARVKLTAFERTTPDIDGDVKFISPDLVESRSGSYYDVRIDVDQRPHGLTLTPGMPAEVFIQTDKRTMLSYLLKPLTEQMSRMFRER